MSSNDSYFTEKESLIAKFYTMRAGLSVVADETMKIKETEREISILDSEIKKNQEDTKKKVAQIDGNLSHYQNMLSDYEKRIRGVQNYKNFKTPASYYWWPACITFIIYMIIYGIIIVFMTSKTVSIPHIFILFESALIPAFFIIPTLVGAFFHRRKKESIKKEIVAKLEEEKGQYESAFARDLSVREKIVENNNYECEKLAKEISKKRALLNSQIIPDSTTMVKSVVNALHKIGNGIISESDWKNIDLLIFYLSTGRADTLKEALQLADRQRQTEQITNVIAEATMYLKENLDNNFAKLGGLINTNFSILRSEIRSNHNDMKRAFTGMESALYESGNALKEEIVQIKDDIMKHSNDILIEELRYNQKYWYK